MTPRRVPSIAHVVFGDAAAHILRRALAQIGLDQPVISLSDDLNVGIIDPLEARGGWIEQTFGLPGYEDYVARSRDSWAPIDDPDLDLVVWVHRADAANVAGLYEVIARRGDKALGVIDLTGQTFRNEHGHLSSGGLNVLDPDQIVRANVIGSQVCLAPAELEFHRATWTLLKKENAPFRILDARGLRSAALTVFDHDITSLVTDEWQICSRVIGHLLVQIWDTGYRQCGDLPLWSRLRALAQDGMFEGRGDFSSMSTCFVRRR